MSKRASEWIPQNILEAARRAGLNAPLWYVGRTNGHEGHERRKTLKDLAEEPQRDEATEARAVKSDRG